jgi:hypothetical protein
MTSGADSRAFFARGKSLKPAADAAVNQEVIAVMAAACRMAEGAALTNQTGGLVDVIKVVPEER